MLHHTVEGSTVNMMTMMIVAIAVIEKNILQTTNKFNLKNPSKGIFSYIFLQVFVSEWRFFFLKDHKKIKKSITHIHTIEERKLQLKLMSDA